jgi:hypothetical protein
LAAGLGEVTSATNAIRVLWLLPPALLGVMFSEERPTPMAMAFLVPGFVAAYAQQAASVDALLVVAPFGALIIWAEISLTGLVSARSIRGSIDGAEREQPLRRNEAGR